MEEGEVEVALLVLEWMEGEHEHTDCKATTSEGEYLIGPFATFWGYCAFFHGKISNVRSPVLDSINDVKVACERHHATGKWE